MERHRHHGPIERTCLLEDKTVPYPAPCGQPYAHPVHYADAAHPYANADGVCGWLLQETGSQVWCGKYIEDAVHHEPSAEQTVVLRMGSSADAPAEDGGSGGEPWAFVPRTVFDPERMLAEEPPVHMSPDHNLFQCEHPDCVRDAKAAQREEDLGQRPVNEAPGSWEAQTAHELEVGGEVTVGPWPVRQYHFDDATGRAACWAQCAALADTGEVFFLEVWWMGNVMRVARVQWGAFSLLSGVDMIDKVRTWPPAG